MFPMSDELNGRSNSLLAELISVVLDVDDDDRAVLTGDALKAIIRMGTHLGGMGEVDMTSETLFSSFWNNGTSTLFYSSPSEYNVLDDINYVLERHTSAQMPYDRCLLRKHRFFDTWSLISLKDYFQKVT